MVNMTKQDTSMLLNCKLYMVIDHLWVIDTLETDVEKFYNMANAAAGTRLRKGLMDAKNIASEIRKKVTKPHNIFRI